MSIQGLGVKVGKIIIGIITQQIVKYTSSEEFHKRIHDMLDKVIDNIIKRVLAENK